MFGFIDLQVNGYKGIEFSDIDLNEENFIYATREILKTGTAAFLPTLITSSREVYANSLAVISKVIKRDEFKDAILGIHLEGPFISKEVGAVGAHNPNDVHEASIEYFEQLQEMSDNNVKLLTIAAEVAGAKELCEYAAQHGVSVSLGHQMALDADVEKLAKAGAKALTHLGNGIPNLIDRHSNTLLAGLAQDELTAMIITDSHHLPDSLIKVIIKTKGVDKVIVVSDASPIAGLAPGRYNMLGNDAVLEENGLLHNPEKKCMVGSSAMMLDCMNYLASLDILSEEELLKVGFYNPLKMINVSPDRIRGEYNITYNKENKLFDIER